ncbi:YdeI/OmpD-associated family protein [Echinicola marina]|uniref:YdeI/OmpD-associated family protein n=1 Tax=Echinicola marina TaxID=2859768 RepID=UPI001CF6E543|nr:DUF1801 domain-containing protein [Echinicola marina]UCS92770.1 YdeI/OmpD-associated family protein [Echinicola marina]
MNAEVDFFFEKAQNWQNEFKQLRSIVSDCGLSEELKWGKPCYTYKSKNILLIHGFKTYCALLFHKGALLKDEENLLIQQTENVQAARQIRFTSNAEIVQLTSSIKAYIYEAIEVEKAGLHVALKKTTEYTVPDELQKILEENHDFKTAFEALTPGRQRGYLLHFSQAKQSKTRLARIEKCMPKIFEGKGYNDR